MRGSKCNADDAWKLLEAQAERGDFTTDVDEALSVAYMERKKLKQRISRLESAADAVISAKHGLVMRSGIKPLLVAIDALQSARGGMKDATTINRE